MKVYILPIKQAYRPAHQSFKYPGHNSDYGVEQDFFRFLSGQKELISSSPDASDWHYLPAFWTRWHLNHGYGKNGLLELQQEMDRVILDGRKTFTICQYGDGPLVSLHETIVFWASRKTVDGMDIPLLCKPHSKLLFPPHKKYLASFVGRLFTHPVRQQMADSLKGRLEFFIYDGNRGARFFVRKMLESYIALCPRGYGGSSFRFFEAMQLGIVPFLIGDIDTRPFKKFINWDKVSFYSNSVSDFTNVLNSSTKSDLLSMGKRAEMVWKEQLTYQKWCQYVIKELEEL